MGRRESNLNARNTSRVCAICECMMQDPKAKILECCGLDRHLNACLNMLKTQDKRVWFTLDRSANELTTTEFLVSIYDWNRNEIRCNRPHRYLIAQPQTRFNLVQYSAFDHLCSLDMNTCFCTTEEDSLIKNSIQ